MNLGVWLFISNWSADLYCMQKIYKSPQLKTSAIFLLQAGGFLGCKGILNLEMSTVEECTLKKLSWHLWIFDWSLIHVYICAKKEWGFLCAVLNSILNASPTDSFDGISLFRCHIWMLWMPMNYLKQLFAPKQTYICHKITIWTYFATVPIGGSFLIKSEVGRVHIFTDHWKEIKWIEEAQLQATALPEREKAEDFGSLFTQMHRINFIFKNWKVSYWDYGLH